MVSRVTMVLRKKPNKLGECPLALRIANHGQISYIHIGHHIHPKYWDKNKRIVKNSHEFSELLNSLIHSKLAEASKTLITLQRDNNDISARQVRQEIVGPAHKITFFSLADDYLKELKEGNRHSTFSADKARINHVRRFVQSKQLRFQEIDESFLKRYASHLRNKHNLSERSVINNLITIRTLFNKAISMGAVSPKLYPFGKGKIKIKFPETKKIGLTIKEIQRIENLIDLTDEEEHTRNVWLFSFNLAGIRAADVIKVKWSDIYDGRLHYRMNKNGKLVSLALPPKIPVILESYAHLKRFTDDFVFPELKGVDETNSKMVYEKTKWAVKKFNASLQSIANKAKITKKLTMHIARHSFGNIAGGEIPVQILQKLYRHSSVTTTMMYQRNFISQKADEALNKVVGF